MADVDPRYRRMLRDGQACVVQVFDSETLQVTDVYRSASLLLEAPNWIGRSELILNGDGMLWRLNLANGVLEGIDVPDLPYLNNDHVPARDGDTLYVSAFDWHIHRLSLSTGAWRQVSVEDPQRPLRRFLHGLSPDGTELAFVGIEPAGHNPWGPANIYAMPAAGGAPRQLTFGGRPADGSEYSADGDWIYFNTEAFGDKPGHAQIARMRRDGGGLEQLTFDERVNWFPHLAPVGGLACYLSYPPGVVGHPENKPVELKLVRNGLWNKAVTVTRLNGGQGTINVNSWSSDGTCFAFVSYPFGA